MTYLSRKKSGPTRVRGVIQGENPVVLFEGEEYSFLPRKGEFFIYENETYQIDTVVWFKGGVDIILHSAVVSVEHIKRDYKHIPFPKAACDWDEDCIQPAIAIVTEHGPLGQPGGKRYVCATHMEEVREIGAHGPLYSIKEIVG